MPQMWQGVGPLNAVTVERLPEPQIAYFSTYGDNCSDDDIYGQVILLPVLSSTPRGVGGCRIDKVHKSR